MPGVPVEKIKRGDNLVVRATDGEEVWIRVTECDDKTVTGCYGIQAVPGEKVKKEKMESLVFPRESILRYGRK